MSLAILLEKASMTSRHDCRQYLVRAKEIRILCKHGGDSICNLHVCMIVLDFKLITVDHVN